MEEGVAGEMLEGAELTKLEMQFNYMVRPSVPRNFRTHALARDRPLNALAPARLPTCWLLKIHADKGSFSQDANAEGATGANKETACAAQDGDDYVFMDMTTFDTETVSKDVIGNSSAVALHHSMPHPALLDSCHGLAHCFRAG